MSRAAITKNQSESTWRVRAKGTDRIKACITHVRRIRVIAAVIFAISVISIGAIMVVAIMQANRLMEPAIAKLERPVGLQVKEVRISSESGSSLAGWLVEANHTRGTVLLLHGVRGNRSDMVGLMQFFHAFNYDVLAIDMQAHGESLGEHISFGYLESRDAAAAVQYLWERNPDGPVFVFGRSLGGAAAIMAHYKEPPTALIVEAAFADIETAIANRMEIHLGEWGRALTPLLSWQFKPRLGISTDDISPVKSIQKLTMPILIIYGLEDMHCRPEEAEALIASAGSSVEFMGVAGADHNSINRVSPQTYLQRILDFLEAFTTPSTAQPAN